MGMPAFKKNVKLKFIKEKKQNCLVPQRKYLFSFLFLQCHFFTYFSRDFIYKDLNFMYMIIILLGIDMCFDVV